MCEGKNTLISQMVDGPLRGFNPAMIIVNGDTRR
jgi:hypothetical protein